MTQEKAKALTKPSLLILLVLAVIISGGFTRYTNPAKQEIHSMLSEERFRSLVAGLQQDRISDAMTMSAIRDRTILPRTTEKRI